MAEPTAHQQKVRRRAGMRLRTTCAAVIVVALALGVAAVALVFLVRSNLAHNLASTASARADAMVAQIEVSGPPTSTATPSTDSSGRGAAHDDPEDVFTEVYGPGGTLISTTDDDFRLPTRLVGADRDDVALGEDHDPFVLRSEDADWQEQEYTVTVGVSRDDIRDTTDALVPLLGFGIPALLLVVAATTWFVVGRALRPVDRMRAEVDAITDDRLDRRVDVPRSRDEIGRLASTMNRMLARLERSRRQQTQFVSDASHELRSPVATLRQAAQVQATHPEAFETGEFAEIVQGESERMERLVDQMLLLTRADEGSAAAAVEIDLDDLMLAEATRLRRTSSLAVETSGIGPARVVGDPIAWSQIVRNLVDNAARHANARVGLTLSQDPAVLLYVDDDGAGIAPADREAVFERFVRLDEARSRDGGGSGLGLAIVRDLVTSAGGRVTVTESPWGGARFTVAL